jgi:hypothetical protein
VPHRCSNGLLAPCGDGTSEAWERLKTKGVRRSRRPWGLEPRSDLESTFYTLQVAGRPTTVRLTLFAHPVVPLRRDGSRDGRGRGPRPRAARSRAAGLDGGAGNVRPRPAVPAWVALASASRPSSATVLGREASPQRRYASPSRPGVSTRSCRSAHTGRRSAPGRTRRSDPRNPPRCTAPSGPARS